MFSNRKTRLSVREIMKEENKDKLNAFLRAWKRVKELPPDNPNSFWCIAGFHGFPPKLNQHDSEVESDSSGFCQHANVLFPMWHRFHILRMEQSLQAVCPDDDVAMCYWDETSEETLKEGLPRLLTDEKVWIDGIEEENPLKSYILQKQLGSSKLKADDEGWKPKGYESKRYPYAGLMNDKHKAETETHNSWIGGKFNSHEELVNELNRNVIRWLKEDVRSAASQSTFDKFVSCLSARSYNSFSNKTSAKEKMDDCLEAPHDDIHLCIGGGFKDLLISRASGDMAFVDNAAFDPIFFFHHCNIDRVFWMWQLKHNCTEKLEITDDDEGACVNKDPTPFQKLKQKLTMTTPLHPFQLTNGLPATAKDGVNIANLNYRYSDGSLMNLTEKKAATLKSNWIDQNCSEEEVAQRISASVRSKEERITVETSLEGLPVAIPREIEEDPDIKSNWMLRIDNFNPKVIKGSFVVSLFWKNIQTPDSPMPAGTFSVFRRWREEDCGNCLLRPKGETFQFDISKLVTQYGLRGGNLKRDNFSFEINCFDRNVSLKDLEEVKNKCEYRIFAVIAPKV